MKGQGKPQGPVIEVNWEVEEMLVEKLKKMENFSAMSVQELVHIALRRFISQHSDYLPKD